MLYPLYHFITLCSAKPLRAMTQRRLANGKEDPDRYPERFGISTKPRPQGRVMWVHGASIGESLSVLPLIHHLHSRLPGWHFVLTTNTVTSAQILAQRLPDYVTHHYIPWDHPTWVKKFIQHWQPQAVLWLESELWPNLLHEIKKNKIPAALLNARLSPKSAKRWRWSGGLIQHMLSTFRFILVGGRDYRPLFESFGGKNVHYIGSLKFGAKPLPVNETEKDALQIQIGPRRVIGFLQTHEGEETLFADSFVKLKQTYPDLLGIIVPRHPQRGDQINTLLQEKKLRSAQRSHMQAIDISTDIYIGDTIGEMGLWYSLCPITVIGGSFVPHGGQNPIEGIHFGTAIFYGPSMFNFVELCSALEQGNAAKQIASSDDLYQVLDHALRHPQSITALSQAAQDLASQNFTVIEAYAEEIITQLECAG